MLLGWEGGAPGSYLHLGTIRSCFLLPSLILDSLVSSPAPQILLPNLIPGPMAATPAPLSGPQPNPIPHVNHSYPSGPHSLTSSPIPFPIAATPAPLIPLLAYASDPHLPKHVTIYAGVEPPQYFHCKGDTSQLCSLETAR